MEVGGSPMMGEEAKSAEDKNGVQRRVWESQDFTITKIVVEEGQDGDNGEMMTPRFGAACSVQVSAISCSGVDLNRLRNDSTISRYLKEKNDCDWPIGGGDTEVDITLERVLQTMRVGEKCEAAIRVKFDSAKNCLAGLPPSSDCWVEVECALWLRGCVNAEPVHKWYAETKMEKAKEANAAAVALFKAKRRLDALRKFRQTLTLLTFVLDESAGNSELAAEAEDLSMTCRSNLAACHFQWGNYTYVIELASRVLERQPDNVKLLYRRGVAHLEKNEFGESKADLVEAHRLDPTNKAINEKLGQLRVREKRHLEELSKGMKKMFA